jgi:DNA-binding NarL/FixJ family response regulator
MVNILLVEDNRFFREEFKKRLLEYFPTLVIEEAGDGDEALQKINKVLFQLIFMDIRLPGVNGLKITQKVKTDFPSIKIAILTSYDLPEYRQAAIQYGADGFLVKNLLNWDEVETLVRLVSTNAH